LIGIPLPELEALMRHIEALGHQPVLVESSADGLKQALRQPAQIIILDMELPDLKP